MPLLDPVTMALRPRKSCRDGRDAGGGGEDVMVATLSRSAAAALTALALCISASCGESDPYDEATRVSVFEDLAATLRDHMRVPAPYGTDALPAGDPALADRDKARRLIGNGLGTTDLRRVSRDGAVVGVLQATVFSALAPAGSAETLVAGYAAGAAPAPVSIGSQTIAKYDGAYLWARGRVVVVISGPDNQALRDLAESYVRGRTGER